jgi:predicted transposase/invertase (TIGR01784 family)
LSKLNKVNELKYNESTLIDWLQFINADRKEVIEVLAEKNDNIKTAYEILKAISRDEKKRLAYESRQMALMDEATRLEEAREEGMEKGIEKGREAEKKESKKSIVKNKYVIATNMKNMGLDIELISKATEISIEDLKEKVFNDKDI